MQSGRTLPFGQPGSVLAVRQCTGADPTAFPAVAGSSTLRQLDPTNVLYHAHSGLRYLVLLAGLLALIVFAYGLIARRPVRSAPALTATFAALVDLQLVLGFGLFFGGIFYDALVGHMVMMILAAVAANGAATLAPRAETERRELAIRLGGVIIALVCIVLGIMAIGRSVLGSAPATVM